MEFISDRVSIERPADGGMSVVIGNRLPNGQLYMLIGWLVAWLLCGAAFLHELVTGTDPELRVPLVVMLVFWAYFQARILRVVLWRTKGFELWRLKEGELTVKDSLFGFGKANRYFVANIQRFGPLNIDKDSWKWQLSASFWTRGAEQLGFEYQGRKVAFGRGLTDAEARALAQQFGVALKRERKAEA
ncbi:MAG: hypothetical protein KBH07_07990 [Flavobacteriales bacterium]|nr:hypothetical protein [Flavobacteriales bacterium]MBP9080132.1 hypothetical protein [Flavobacteriales bacterium]